jgi:hypothetical protein
MSETRGVRIGFLFVPFPQEIWKGNLDLTLGEFRLLGYLLMHQVRFGRSIVMLSDDELLSGRRDRGGERVDQGCGIRGRNNLRDGRRRLEARGWIRTSETRQGRMYEIVIEGSETDRVSNKSDHEGSETDHPKRTGAASESDRLASETDRPASETDQRNKEREKSREKSESKSSIESSSAYADERHSLVKSAITRLQKHFLEFELWDDAEDRKLQQLLSRKPEVSGSRLVDCVVSRFLSPVSSADPPRKWIGKLLEYAGGPKNSFDDLVRFEVEDHRRLRAIATASEDPQQSIQVEQVSVAEHAEMVELEIPSPIAGTWNGSTPADTWHRVQMRLEAMLSRLTFDTWIKPTRGVEYVDGVLVVSVPTSEFTALRDRYAEELVRVLHELRVPCKRLQFRVVGAR